MLNNFIYSKTKNLFTKELEAGNILNEAIVFIEDTKEIWNHGTYFDGSKVDLSNIETSILNILNNKLDNISDLEVIRNGAALGATAVQPNAIADMETKTNAAATYLPKGNYVVEDVVSDGVYAVAADGSLIDYNSADASALGVALVAGEHKFMIAKSDATNDGSNYNLYYDYDKGDLSLTNYSNADGTNSYGYLDGSSTPQLSQDFTTWTEGALSDFNGKSNTQVIAASSSNAKDMCKVLETFNAGSDNQGHSDWYVPAAGQLALMYLAKTDINAALANIGGTAFNESFDYWSSSESDAGSAWSVIFYNGYVDIPNKNGGNRVRFVRDISVKSLKERVSELESKIKDLNTSSSGANVQAVDTGDIVEDVNVEYATTAYVDGLIGDINTILESIINS